MPVVDKEDRLVGIITVDDAMYVQNIEAEEDFAKMGYQDRLKLFNENPEAYKAAMDNN